MSPATARPGLVVFDCDGVLVDTERVTLRVMQGWVAHLGWQLSLDDVAERFKGTHISVIHRLVEERLGRAVPGFVEGYRSRMFEAFAEGIDPMPGAAAMLDALRAAGVPFCVASNGPHAKMDASLSSAGLAWRIGGLKKDGGGRVFSADDVAAPKPAPDLFLHAAARMGVEPARCVVVEDSPSGIEAARAAGMQSIGLSDLTPAEALRAAGAERVALSLAEVAAMLGVG